MELDNAAHVVAEHIDTVRILRAEILADIHAWICSDLNYSRVLAYWEKRKQDAFELQNMLDRCTTLQLRSIASLIRKNTPDSPDLMICPCNPTDHVVVTLGTIYVGIETDGYTHS